MKYKRILLKLSGEALCGSQESGLDHSAVIEIAREIKDATKKGIQVAVVVGGGNIWRFRDNEESGIERTSSDYIGMLATIMNSVALQSTLESIGVDTRVCSAIDIPQLAEPYLRRRALRHLEKGRVVICAGGTGNPYFTTDSAAALRATELQCDIVLKATNVKGVYDSDPKTNPDAKFLDELKYKDAIVAQLKVMDQAAFSLCMENNMPICVFNFGEKGNLSSLLNGKKIGTNIHS
ncbi:MAG: UMP kinase [Candidatus Peribacteraceae bacterium]|nr:UMP kinase [Candidatus Peribacteraceae bacterium]